MRKKKFFDTVVGRVLKGAASIIAPGLVNSLEGVKDVGQAIGIIRNSTEIDEATKLELEKLALDQYRAEVDDRISARQREAVVAASGGNDIMFKVVGGGVLLLWGITLWALFFGDLEITPEKSQLLNIAFGGLSIKVTQIVSYYFGSSSGSKQKTHIMNGN